MNRSRLVRVVYTDPLAGIRPGDIVQIQYKDHVLFQNADASKQEPRLMRCVGRVDVVKRDHVRISFENYHNPGDKQTRSTGLVILKSMILEIRRVGR